jgi:hypothetical protein
MGYLIIILFIFGIIGIIGIYGCFYQLFKMERILNDEYINLKIKQFNDKNND